MEGPEPIKLPETIGVTDQIINSNLIAIGDDLTNPGNITDMTAFSVIFSPGGELELHSVKIRNRNCVTTDGSEDMIFNTGNNVVNNQKGMFIQDDYPGLGLGAENSRNSFVIYDKPKFREMDAGQRFNYINSLPEVHINPYSGTLIGE